MGLWSRKIGPVFGWQMVAGLAVFLVAGVGTFSLTNPGVVEVPTGLADDEQLTVATVGDLVDSISTSGTVVFPNRERHNFTILGDIAKVGVSQGDQVSIGQELARLDESTRVSLQKAVAKAQVAVRDAEDALSEELKGPDPLTVAKAGEAVARKAVVHSEAMDVLEDLLDVTELEIREAQLDVEHAAQAERNAKADVISAKQSRTDAETDESTAVTSAETAYSDVFRRWLGITLAVQQLQVKPSDLLSTWGVDLEVLFGTRTVLSPERVSVTPVDDSSTAWNESTVYSWATLYPGPISGTCSDGAPSRGVCAEKEIDDAWNTLTGARDSLISELVAASKVILKAETALGKASDELEAANDALALLLSPDELQIADAEADVGLAAAELASAKEDYAEANSGIDALDVGLLESQLAVARQELTTAQDQLKDSVLVSTISGYVDVLEMEIGDRANQASVFIEVVDASVVEIDGSVDEVDVLAIELGMPAAVSMTALGDQTLLGTISEIGSAETGQTGVVTFPITIRLDVPDGTSLREGLSATSQVVLDEFLNVLLIPTSAVSGSFISPTVRVSKANTIEERKVQLGPSDDFWVVVLSGVVAGEKVVMPEPAEANTQFSGFRGLLGGRGGGRGGSGRGGGSGGGSGRGGGGR